ncbi:hypothetical protein [Microvirga massiliensis]|uniref:hypothetical protein n=1 Tax=Microvirga massiliensis TaxID=1033741 RepID=UPI00062B3120|nr:hypothetical protein [Microvirga massiliensis]
MSVEDDLLLKRAEVALAETARLREAHEHFLEQVDQQLAQMRQIEAELDPLLPHRPEELREVKTLLTRDEDPQSPEAP